MSTKIDKHLTTYLRLQKTVVKDEIDDGYEPEMSESDSQRNSQYFQWSAESTRLLLKLRFDPIRKSQFENRTHQRKELWDEIATEMFKEGGYQLSADICDLKYRNLLQTFKKNRNKELNGLDPNNISWSYYDTFRTAFENEDANDSKSSSYPNDCINYNTFRTSLDHENAIDSKSSLIANDCSNDGDENIICSPANKRQKIKFESPFVPIVELRAPSKRLSNKRQMNPVTIIHSMPSFAEPVNKSKQSPQPDNTTEKASISKVTSSSTAQHPLNSFEIEECRIFGETVGVQLSLIRSSDTRALAELKIQEILYAAKISKLKV